MDSLLLGGGVSQSTLLWRSVLLRVCALLSGACPVTGLLSVGLLSGALRSNLSWSGLSQSDISRSNTR